MTDPQQLPPDRQSGDDSIRGAFSEAAPWTLRYSDITWRPPLRAVRSVVRRRVPTLTAPRRWPGFRAPQVVGRFGVDFVSWAAPRWLGRRRIALGLPAAGDRANPEAPGFDHAPLYRKLRISAEQLGPAYIKLGQIISSGQGIFPAELVEEFKRCRDQVPPEPFDMVRRVVEADFGLSLKSVFTEFDREPLAAASIAQVHRARLRGEFVAPFSGGAVGDDKSVEVVVKVQRPQVAVVVRRRSEVLAWLAPFLVGPHPRGGAGQPAGAGRGVRRDDLGRTRLPPRSREHARRGAGRSPRSTQRRLSSSPGRTRRSSPDACS